MSVWERNSAHNYHNEPLNKTTTVDLQDEVKKAEENLNLSSDRGFSDPEIENRSSKRGQSEKNEKKQYSK